MDCQGTLRGESVRGGGGRVKLERCVRTFAYFYTGVSFADDDGLKFIGISLLCICGLLWTMLEEDKAEFERWS